MKTIEEALRNLSFPHYTCGDDCSTVITVEDAFELIIKVLGADRLQAIEWLKVPFAKSEEIYFMPLPEIGE